MAAYVCAVCGSLALPTNSNLVDGQRFVHRACQDQARQPLLCVDDKCRRHAFFCVDDGCRGECWPEPVVDTDGLEPVEPPDHWSGADTRAEFAGEK